MNDSIKDNITGSRIANEIKIKKDGYINILVEGVNDELLFHKFICHNNCKIQICFGYEKVIQAITTLNNENLIYNFGIIDKDFRVINNDILDIQNLFYTDLHDLEITILKSNAFNLVMHRYASQQKINGITTNIRNSLIDHFLEICKPLCLLKYVNQKYKCGLFFKPHLEKGNQIDLNQFIDIKSLTFKNKEDMIVSLINYSCHRGKVMTKQEILEKYDLHENDNHDINQLSNGHLVCLSISLALKKSIGSSSNLEVEVSQLEKDFVSFYDSMEFIKTELYQSIKIWENHRCKKVLMV